MVAQGCRASVVAIWAHHDHPDTASYLSPSAIVSMHKVALEVKGESQLRNLSEKLMAGGIEHKLWIEKPEEFPTSLATRLYPKSQVSSFKKLKLSDWRKICSEESHDTMLRTKVDSSFKFQ